MPADSLCNYSFLQTKMQAKKHSAIAHPLCALEALDPIL
jgi:hypothetical protein